MLNQIKAIQKRSQYHSPWNTRAQPTPLKFAAWFTKTAKEQQKAGLKIFGFASSKTFTLITPDGRITIRSEESFFREYNSDYLSLFSTPKLTNTPFEENAGVLA